MLAKDKQDFEFGPNEARLFLRRQGIKNIPGDDLLTPMCATLLQVFDEMKAKDSEIINLRKELKELQRRLNESQKTLHRNSLTIESLSELAETDQLTGVANRRGFEKNLQGMIDRRNRNDESQLGDKKLPVATILFIDINDFKKFNEEYSHVMGDSVLTFVANILEKHTRSGDYLARVGGDEFALVLYGADSLKADKIGKKIMKAVIDESYDTFPDGGVSVTFGAHQVTPEDNAKTILDSISKNMLAGKTESKQFARGYLQRKDRRKSPDDISPA